VGLRLFQGLGEERPVASAPVLGGRSRSSAGSRRGRRGRRLIHLCRHVLTGGLRVSSARLRARPAGSGPFAEEIPRMALPLIKSKHAQYGDWTAAWAIRGPSQQIMGAQVKDSQGQDLGTINDVIINQHRDGMIRCAFLEFKLRAANTPAPIRPAQIRRPFDLQHGRPLERWKIGSGTLDACPATGAATYVVLLLRARTATSDNSHSIRGDRATPIAPSFDQKQLAGHYPAPASKRLLHFWMRPGYSTGLPLRQEEANPAPNQRQHDNNAASPGTTPDRPAHKALRDSVLHRLSSGAEHLSSGVPSRRGEGRFDLLLFFAFTSPTDAR